MKYHIPVNSSRRDTNFPESLFTLHKDLHHATLNEKEPERRHRKRKWKKGYFQIRLTTNDSEDHIKYRKFDRHARSGKAEKLNMENVTNY